MKVVDSHQFAKSFGKPACADDDVVVISNRYIIMFHYARIPSSLYKELCSLFLLIDPGFLSNNLAVLLYSVCTVYTRLASLWEIDKVQWRQIQALSERDSKG